MNYRTMVKGALALSLSLTVGTAMALTETPRDVQEYGATFEAGGSAASKVNDYDYELGTNITKYADATTGTGWFSGAEEDESKIISRDLGEGATGQALQLNTDAATLTNKFASGVATAINDAINDNGTAFFETEVKFVASDTLDAGITGGQDATKFAIYAYCDDQAETVTTNLVVFHAYEYTDANEDVITAFTNEVFKSVSIDTEVYTKLRITMKKFDNGDSQFINVFSVSVNDGEPISSPTAKSGGIWFQTVEDIEDTPNTRVSSLNFKGTGEIDNIKVGTIAIETEYAVKWTDSVAVTVTNAAGTVLGASDTNFPAGASIYFTADATPEGNVITNVLINGVVDSNFAGPAATYTYTVEADATVTVLAGVPASEPTGFAAGDDVDGIITQDQADWLNAFINNGTYTKAQLEALTGWQDKYLLNVDPFTGSGTLTVTAITVGNDVQVTVALARTEGDPAAAVTGKAIKGVLKLYGTADLGTNFAELGNTTIGDDDFSEGDTTTATFTGTGAQFFKAVIVAPAAAQD